jgi:hypothetical protein
MRRLHAWAVVVVTVLALTGCGEGDAEDHVDGDRATARLEQQRTDVRAAARDLLHDAARRLGGSTGTSTGAWRGCESAGIEEYRNFRYLAQARVDAGDDTPAPYLRRLSATLEDAGFEIGGTGVEPGAGPGGRLVGTRGDLTAVFSESGGAFVGLDVYGPCVDVPQGERSAWLRREEPTPDLLQH